MTALGPQGAAAIAEIREPGRILRYPAGDLPPIVQARRPNPAPALRLGDPVSTRSLEAVVLRAALAERERRIAELEGELAHALRQVDAAREAGRRDEREVNARTLGGRVPSIGVIRT